MFTLFFVFLNGCSIRKAAVNEMADALANSGVVFAGDEDPQLVREALPFSLKLMEVLVLESPENADLLAATARGFVQYTYAFIQQDMDRLELDDIEASDQMRLRARKLYLRARDYGLRALDAESPGFSTAIFEDPESAAKRVDDAQVMSLYWTAAAWAAAISISRDEPLLLGELPVVDALIDRAVELDSEFENGALYSLLISYEFARPSTERSAVERARAAFANAIRASSGHASAPYVSLAETVAVEEQDSEEFERLLESALAVDPDETIELRLVNLIMQDRARWLLDQKDDLFWK
jgi:predicted anti-sigma-YlaC factor YlaD